ncbi:MAG: iron-containing alcohol dehydrogenase [Candidatus Cloacimonetes bacterium]|nr:iron-containing alcohol dehydrogenase [Candidatus Cloacimonadota bacterium]MDD4790972.1 iron-containing alcohol dehydrogenase [Candidatus Cloacimonadota bacterium]MDD5315890.1 iron-containing alcohol dehydrogenase [Candidatus Cloacimonadota bacterium]
MEAFAFHNPTRILFGNARIEELGGILKNDGIRKCHLIAGGGSLRENGAYERIQTSLKAAGIELTETWGVQANPTLDKVKEIVEQLQNSGSEAIIAAGGSSVIDTAKAAAAGCFLKDPWNAFTEKEKIEKALPIYTVLTLSATGSEMNGNAVITNTQSRQKWGMFSPLLYPKLSIIDPTLQSTLPFKQTANGAMDAIAHILEFYFADEKALSTLAIDDALLRTIVEMTDRLHYNAQDIVARGNLAWSATLALNGLSGVGMNGGDWGCHGIEHAFSALHPEIAHGEGLGVIFPAWIEYLSEKTPSQFLRWARCVWNEDTVALAVRRFRNKLHDWGLAGSLRELGIKQNELSTLLDMIMIQPTIGGVFKLNKEEVRSLLMLAF